MARRAIQGTNVADRRAFWLESVAMCHEEEFDLETWMAVKCGYMMDSLISALKIS